MATSASNEVGLSVDALLLRDSYGVTGAAQLPRVGGKKVGEW